MPPDAHITKESILIVDDQPLICEMLEKFLRKRGYHVASSLNANDALQCVAQEHFDLVITDVFMPGTSGFELLEEIKAGGRGEDVIIMTGFASINQCVDAMRRGAAEYITKPFQLGQVLNIVEQTLARRREKLLAVNSSNGNGHGSAPLNGDKNGAGRAPRRAAKTHQPSLFLIGQSPIMEQLFALIDQIALTDSSVVITGPTGTGKEVIARAIHERSRRGNGPFVDINCSAIPDTLIEAELFGHQRGTFTGAHETRRGLFEAASGGTLFLDEVDALNLAAQAKLLRVLQERQLRRVGGRENISFDVRIVSATNRDLHAAIADGAFRPDLYFRLCVVPLHVPMLRERREDIELLVEHFLRRYTERRAMPPRRFSVEAMRAVMNYHWPGNVRELENVVEYTLAIGAGEEIGVNDLPPDVLKGRNYDLGMLNESASSNATLAEVERCHILAVLAQHDGHLIKTAAALGIDRRTLYRKLQDYEKQSVTA